MAKKPSINSDDFQDLFDLYRSMRTAQIALSKILTVDKKAALAVVPDPHTAMKHWDEIGSRALELAAGGLD